MKKQLGIATLLLIPAGAALAYSAGSQEKKATPAVATKDDPSMAKMMEFAKVGPSHKALEVKVGKWTASVKAFMPGGETVEANGSSEIQWIMDGRFLKDTFTGEWMGKPFHGEGRMGFDNLKKKYVSTWLDDAGTGIYFSEGAFDAASKSFSFTGDSPDTDAGKYVKSRTTEKWTDNDHFTMQSFVPGPDGKERLSMEIAYARAH
ncbi:MAG: DUF1579 domain-containing protein [Planctomycetes bacterium]|nr:DUF1579 domain-containing protein [Planctomycetota bacterium]